MNLILLGSPGSGKGTQAKRLKEKYGLRHISTGDIFRKEIADQSEFGKQIQKLVNEGELVPDSLVIEVLASNIKDEKQGLIFDGFPRTVEQAKALDTLLEKQNKKLDAVIFIDVPAEKVIKRITSRRICAKCNAVYGAEDVPADNKCRKCGGDLIIREDDNEESVKNRLSVYHKQTEPLIAFYTASGKLIRIDGSKDIEDVFEDIVQALDK